MLSKPETVQYGPTDNPFENHSRAVDQRDRTWRTPKLVDVACGKMVRAYACLEYFGSLSHDALCLALWAVWNSTCFEDAVRPLLMAGGDADTTGAIAGQLAGAVYGMHGPRGVMRACDGHWWRLARKSSLAEDAAAIVVRAARPHAIPGGGVVIIITGDAYRLPLRIIHGGVLLEGLLGERVQIIEGFVHALCRPERGLRPTCRKAAAAKPWALPGGYFFVCAKQELFLFCFQKLAGKLFRRPKDSFRKLF
jgi:hypothetical protein